MLPRPIRSQGGVAYGVEGKCRKLKVQNAKKTENFLNLRDEKSVRGKESTNFVWNCEIRSGMPRNRHGWHAGTAGYCSGQLENRAGRAEQYKPGGVFGDKLRNLSIVPRCYS